MGYLWPYLALIPNPLLSLLAEFPTNTLNEMGSCKVVYKKVRYSMRLCMVWDFGKAGIGVA